MVGQKASSRFLLSDKPADSGGFFNITEWLSFDDVLLVPKYSQIFKDEVEVRAKLTKNLTLKIPLVSSPMDTVTESGLAIGLAQAGGLGIIHRNLSINGEAGEVKKVKKWPAYVPLSGITVGKAAVDKKGRLLVGAAVGVGTDLFPRIEAVLPAGADVICLDSAHGHADYIIKATRSIKRKYPAIELISGNVGNAGGFENLAKAGADAVRVGVGPGSICTTRIVSGVGAPQLSAIMDCASVSRRYKVGLIADGGIKQAGDIVKALAAGAFTVMIGSLFARVKEAPGEVVTIKAKKYKYYRGMGSVAAMKKGSAGRYGQLASAKRLVAEGVEGLVPYKGELKDFVFQLIGGVKSGMEYVGAKNLDELYHKAEFVKVTRSGLVESHPHNVIITNGGESYH